MFEPLDGGLRIVRVVHAPCAAVFDAWVNPQRLRSWWGPPGITVIAVRGHLCVGGEYRIAMETADGDPVELVWTFRDISRPSRLVYDWRWTVGAGEPREQSCVTIAFRDLGDRTEIELTHTGIVGDAVRNSHAAGWIGCLDGLDTMVNQVV